MATYNIMELLSTDIETSIPLDALHAILSSPPFYPISGTFNFREVIPGYAYRSGALKNITEEGKAKLALELGVMKVFDLRTVLERNASPPPELGHVEIVWIPSEEEPQAGELILADFFENEEQAFVKSYTGMLKTYKLSFKAVLSHVRDNPKQPFLFHCSAGKDRTGVLAAIILHLAGFGSEDIALDYARTRIGVEPAREAMMIIVQKDLGLDITAPGFKEMCSIRSANMTAFMEMMNKNGGLDGYVKNDLGFGEEDILKIRLHLSMKRKTSETA